ncbi:MAG TPA: DsbE family thiol:disulfide interchange protein [Burkholderiales bacterium]|nr:DsbE family thiol:disulfide interchange protein [Burkholderiales bacterium]
MTRLVVALGVLGLLVVLLAVGLSLNPSEVPSPLIGKPAPAFSLPRLDTSTEKLSPEALRGKVWVLNVWASWCAPCRDEIPVLMKLARSKTVPIYGLNYKDQHDQALALLKQLGDPYVASAVDADGRVGIDYGVYGVPETYVIDQAGVIRLKHIGPVTPETVEKKIAPLLKELAK